MPRNLSEIRNASNYPALRLFVAITTLVGYVAALLFAAAGVLAHGMVDYALPVGIAVAVLLLLLTHLARELLLIAADTADAVVSMATAVPEPAAHDYPEA